MRDAWVRRTRFAARLLAGELSRLFAQPSRPAPPSRDDFWNSLEQIAGTNGR